MVEIKHKFWEQLNEVTKDSAGRLIVFRDLNRRMGGGTGVRGERGEGGKDDVSLKTKTRKLLVEYK